MADEKFWTPTDRMGLVTVTSIEELGIIPLRILERMKYENPKIVMICGPMTTGGIKKPDGTTDFEKNMEQFGHVVEKALGEGFFIFNQAVFQRAMIRLFVGWDCPHKFNLHIMEHFYTPIFRKRLLHHTFFIPGWEESTGAKIERRLAGENSIGIDECPRRWLKWVPELNLI